MVRFFLYMNPIHRFSHIKYMFMKNATNQETEYPMMPALRVVFRNEDIVEEKNSQAGNARKQVEKIRARVEPTQLPQFDDYRIKARDHDPL